MQSIFYGVCIFIFYAYAPKKGFFSIVSFLIIAFLLYDSLHLHVCYNKFNEYYLLFSK